MRPVTNHYRVVAPAFCCGVTFMDGRISKKETAPYLQRLAGIGETAFLRYAEERGWKIEKSKQP